jgi:hypothetical protein
MLIDAALQSAFSIQTSAFLSGRLVLHFRNKIPQVLAADDAWFQPIAVSRAPVGLQANRALVSVAL